MRSYKTMQRYKTKFVWILQKTSKTEYDTSEINDVVGVFTTKGQAQNELSKLKQDWFKNFVENDFVIETDELLFYAYNKYEEYEYKITKWSLK